MNTFDQAFLSPEFLQDPYPWYEELRARAPLAFQERWGSYFVTDFEDINAILRDRRFVRTTPASQQKRRSPADAFQEMGDNTLMDMEPPDHTRLKGLVMNIFTPRRVESLRANVQALALDLAQQARSHGSFDLLHDLAEPLSVTVIADLLGIPQEIRASLRPWSRDIVAMFELTPSAADRETANRAVESFSAALAVLVEEKRDHPADDLLSGLAAAEARGKIRREEVLATSILLLNAGHEATVNTTGNGMLAMLRTPGQWQALRDDPSLTRGAMEEMLRFDTPLQLFFRWVREDVDYKDIHFRKDQRIALLYGAGNRDPARFPHPAQFDITRQDNPHLTFGSGIHYCLGAPLARLELVLTLQALLQVCPNLELDTPIPCFNPSFVIRGLTGLPLRCGV